MSRCVDQRSRAGSDGFRRILWCGLWRVIAFVGILALQACAITDGVGGTVENASHNSATRWQAQQLFANINNADAAYQAGRWKQASGYYRGVLEQAPQDPYAWFRLGNSLTRQGEYGSAIQAYEASLRYDARQTKPWFNLSTAHLLGAQLATLNALDSMIQNDPSRQAIQLRLDALTQLLQ